MYRKYTYRYFVYLDTDYYCRMSNNLNTCNIEHLHMVISGIAISFAIISLMKLLQFLKSST